MFEITKTPIGIQLHLFHLIHFSKALDLHLSVTILRLKEGLDYSKIITDEVTIVTTEPETTAATSFLQQLNSQETLPRNESFISTMSQGCHFIVFQYSFLRLYQWYL